MVLRVIAGTARSIPLKFPRGARIRPTTDAMREALFSSLCDCT
ncbi:RsmD family RNA methyltransferase, partial [Escherichia coli]